jgi:hypothetical protein
MNTLDIFGRTFWKADRSIARHLRAQDSTAQRIHKALLVGFESANQTIVVQNCNM